MNQFRDQICIFLSSLCLATTLNTGLVNAKEPQIKSDNTTKELAYLVSEIYTCGQEEDSQSKILVEEYKTSTKVDYVIYCVEIDCVKQDSKLEGESGCNSEVYNFKVIIDTRKIKDIEVNRVSSLDGELMLIYKDDLASYDLELSHFYQRYQAPYETAKKIEHILRQSILKENMEEK